MWTIAACTLALAVLLLTAVGGGAQVTHQYSYYCTIVYITQTDTTKIRKKHIESQYIYLYVFILMFVLCFLYFLYVFVPSFNHVFA